MARYEFAVVTSEQMDEYLTKDLDQLGQLGYHVVGILTTPEDRWPRILLQRTLEE